MIGRLLRRLLDVVSDTAPEQTWSCPDPHCRSAFTSTDGHTVRRYAAAHQARTGHR